VKIVKTAEIVETPKNKYEFTTHCMIGDADGYSNNSYLADTFDEMMETTLKVILKYYELQHNSRCDATRNWQVFLEKFGLADPWDLDDDLGAGLLPLEPDGYGNMQSIEEWNLYHYDENGVKTVLEVHDDNGVPYIKKAPDHFDGGLKWEAYPSDENEDED
jgi:hypothetical protein